MFNRKYMKYVLILPAGLLFSSMVIFPIFFTLYASFFSWRGLGFKMNFTGLTNYKIIFRDPRFINALENNLIWMIAYLIIPVLLGFILALMLNKGFKGENIFKSGFYFPGVISFIAIGIIFTFVFSPSHGMVNTFIRFIGLENFVQNWLGERFLAIFSIIIAGSWQYLGFCMVLFLAGLRNIPLDILEASDIDGVNYFQKVIHIIIPLLKPVITIVVGITIINSIRVFDLVFAMTKGGPSNSTEVLGLLMYNKAFTEQQWGLGSSYGVIMFILTSFLGLLYIRQMMKGEDIY